MIGTHKALTLAATAAVALSVTAVAASGAQAATTRTKTSATAATTITICVKTKTGTVKVLSAKQAKKKCAKGYKKLTWNAQGPAGKNGTNGTGTNGTNGTNGLNGGSLKVHDSAGNLIGAFAGQGQAPNALFTTYTVLGADGGLYNYLPSGQLMPNFVPLMFRDSACTGPAYISADASISPVLLTMAGSALRVVVRSINEQSLTFGPARAWKITTDWSVVPGNPPTYYQLTELGCAAAQPRPGDALFALRDVPAPPDGVGLLTIG